MAMGISPERTSLQPLRSVWAGRRGGAIVKFDRFIWRRPSSTSRMTSHETGAMLLYQGQTVRWEWQSLQERAKIACTAGSIGGFAAISCEGSIGGFVRAGRIAWITTKKTATPISHLIHLRFIDLLKKRASYAITRRFCKANARECRCVAYNAIPSLYQYAYSVP